MQETCPLIALINFRSHVLAEYIRVQGSILLETIENSLYNLLCYLTVADYVKSNTFFFVALGGR